jgi:hypothetical protein
MGPAEPVDLALAPAPRELPEVFVAPDPHPVLWKFPHSEYSSEWQKVGAVDIRVAALAITTVPIVDSSARVTESAPVLAVLVEARLNTPRKMRTLSSWTYGLNRYGVIFLERGGELDPPPLPRGRKPNTGLPLKQPLPDDGTPVRDVLFFAIPVAGSGELSLRLDAERCGEAGDVWFKIPAAVLKK